MPEDPCARAAHPCRGRFPRSAAGGTAAWAAAAPDKEWPATTLNARIHCEFTAVAPRSRNGLTPIRLAGRPPSQTCGTSGMEPAVLHAPGLRAGAGSSASNLREPRCETGTIGFTSAAHGCITQPLHPCDPAAFRGSCRRYMSCTLGNQTPAEPVSSGSWAKPLLNCPTRRSTAISQTGRGRNTRIDSIAVDRTTGPLMPVQYGGAGPTASPSKTRVGT